MQHNMNNVVISNPGMAISEIILIDSYSLTLRYNRIRERVNEKLRELKLDGVSVKVIVNELDKLLLLISSNRNGSQETISIVNGIDDSEGISNGEMTEKEKFVDSINKVIFNINKKQENMKQSRETVTSVANDEREKIAQEVAKFIVLSAGDIILPLVKCEAINLSEVCQKMTNGAVDSVIVSEGRYTFSNNVISLSYTSTGHSEEEIVATITRSLIFMMVSDNNAESLPVTSDASVSDVKTTDSSKKLEAAYNREVKKSLDGIGTELDNLNRRKYSQRVRGILLKCANRAHNKSLSTASIPTLIRHMSPDNQERVRNLYYIYNQTLPEWQEGESVNKVLSKRTKAAKG